MNLRRLKWTFLLLLLVFFGFIEFSAWSLGPALATWSGRLLIDMVAMVGFLFLAGVAFDRVSRMHRRLERRNRELFALHRASLDVYGDLSLDTVLKKVVEQAAQLLEARYGAISVLDGEDRISQFVTTGLSDSEATRLGAPPTGKGLLGVVLRQGERLRLGDVSNDSRSAGMPPGHPEMRSLLAVPVICKGPFRGNLYLTEKQSASAFSEEDEETLVRFSTTAAIAIDNAYLHQQLRALAIVEERARIGREMHDGLAQVLAYVNTKAQAVDELLRQGKQEQASAQLLQLSEAAREVHGDVREQIAGLRVDVFSDRPLADSLGEVVTIWKRYCAIAPVLEIDPSIELAPEAQLQVVRIVQEALSNIRKHSRAAKAAIHVSANGSSVEVVVEDDGEGFDPAVKYRSEKPRFGLAIMRERAESIGAHFSLASQPGRGTRVTVRIPMTRPQGENHADTDR